MQDIDDSDVKGRRVSADLRNELEARGKLTGWDMQKRPVQKGYSPSEVQLHCVRDSVWQDVRLSMKGIDTCEKLAILEAWWDQWYGFSRSSLTNTDVAEIQVGNYLGALYRGGQINDDYQIRKAR